MPALARTESTRYVGRAVVALATDPRVVAKTGQVLRVGDLATEYGFTDVDGRRVPPFELADAQGAEAAHDSGSAESSGPRQAGASEPLEVA